MAAAAPLKLWDTGICPYTQRVRIALEEKGLEFRHELFDAAGPKPAVRQNK